MGREGGSPPSCSGLSASTWGGASRVSVCTATSLETRGVAHVTRGPCNAVCWLLGAAPGADVVLGWVGAEVGPGVGKGRLPAWRVVRTLHCRVWACPGLKGGPPSPPLIGSRGRGAGGGHGRRGGVRGWFPLGSPLYLARDGERLRSECTHPHGNSNEPGPWGTRAQVGDGEAKLELGGLLQ